MVPRRAGDFIPGALSAYAGRVSAARSADAEAEMATRI